MARTRSVMLSFVWGIGAVCVQRWLGVSTLLLNAEISFVFQLHEVAAADRVEMCFRESKAHQKALDTVVTRTRLE